MMVWIVEEQGRDSSRVSAVFSTHRDASAFARKIQGGWPWYGNVKVSSHNVRDSVPEVWKTFEAEISSGHVDRCTKVYLAGWGIGPRERCCYYEARAGGTDVRWCYYRKHPRGWYLCVSAQGKTKAQALRRARALFAAEKAKFPQRLKRSSPCH
jgi:hypothetical protein